MHPPRPALVGAGYLPPAHGAGEDDAPGAPSGEGPPRAGARDAAPYLPALLAGGPLGGGPRRLAGHWAHSEAPSQGEPAV
jgi:hypothetical protein